jgi:hypothetical protein
MPDPIYTAENIRVAYALRWSPAVFWKAPVPDPESWLTDLQSATEPDGVRILNHRLVRPNSSQFLVSTKAHVSPAKCIRSVKGRLQYLIRDAMPKAFRRNYSMRSVGEANQSVIEKYVATQLDHHKAADPRLDALLEPYQHLERETDLAAVRRSGHGEFIYNLHLAVVHAERFGQAERSLFAKTSSMLKNAAKKRAHNLTRIGMLADHVHWTIGCNLAESPLEVGLCYLNNLAFAHGMRPIYQFGFYVGTFGPYDLGAIRRQNSP